MSLMQSSTESFLYDDRYTGLYNDGHNHDGHKPWRPKTMTMMATAIKMWKTNARCTVKLIQHRWINLTKLFVIVCGRHGHCSWPSLSNPLKNTLLTTVILQIIKQINKLTCNVVTLNMTSRHWPSPCCRVQINKLTCNVVTLNMTSRHWPSPCCRVQRQMSWESAPV